jgi:hypothetical protein
VKEAKKRREERQDVKRKEVLQVPHIQFYFPHPFLITYTL